MMILNAGMWDVIATFPLWIQIIFVLITLSLAVLGGIKGVKDLVAKSRGLKQPKRKLIATEADILNHPIFGKFNHFIDHEVRMLSFGDDKRNKIFRLILTTQFRTYNNKLYKMVTKQDIGKMQTSELRTVVFDVYNEIVNDYNTKIKDAISDELFNVIMDDEVRGYNVWHEPVLQMVKESLDDILDNDMYDNNYERIFAILNSYKNSLKSVKMNVENTYRNFNGQLDKFL